MRHIPFQEFWKRFLNSTSQRLRLIGREREEVADDERSQGRR